VLAPETEEPSVIAAAVPPRLPSPLPAPDRDVLDSARARLAPARPRPASRLQAAADQPTTPARHLPRPLDDLRAASAVAQRAGAPGQPPAEPLDVGAALVLLSNVRVYLDRLEASLLEVAQQAEMSWDLIAAIIGVPAAEAKDRLAALRSRPDPQ
jgi:CTP:molybdopterin cytidylyltransferase MocA